MSSHLLSALSNSLNTPPPITSTPSAFVNHCLSAAKVVIAFGKKNTNISLATVVSEPKAISVLVKRCIALFLMGKANKENEHYAQHLIGAYIASYWLLLIGQKHPAQGQQILKATKQFLSSRQLTLWLDAIALRNIAFSKQGSRLTASASLTREQRSMLLTALLLTDGDCEKAILKMVNIGKIIPTESRDYVKAILSVWDHPLPSQFVSYKNKSLLVLASLRNKVCLFEPDSEEPSPMWVDTSKVTTTKRVAPLHHYINILLQHDQNIVAKSGEGLFSQTYALQRPPASLTHIIDALQSPKLSINALCDKIDKSESFRHFLLNSASHDNRLQLPVKNIKQAVMTFGIERVGDMLIQNALMDRLTQHYFPLKNLCVQLTALASNVAGYLSLQTQSTMTPQSLALVIGFLCSPLFTLPGLKIRYSLPVSEKNYFFPNQLLKTNNKQEWQSASTELARNWHLSKTAIALIQQASRHTDNIPIRFKKDHAIVQLSIGLARECLFSLTSTNSETLALKKKLLDILSLTTHDIKIMQTELSEFMYCPIR